MYLGTVRTVHGPPVPAKDLLARQTRNKGKAMRRPGLPSRTAGGRVNGTDGYLGWLATIRSISAVLSLDSDVIKIFRSCAIL